MKQKCREVWNYLLLITQLTWFGDFNNLSVHANSKKVDICIVLLLSGYLACARCSSTGALVLIEPVSTIKGGNKPLLPPKTERCSNCSGSGKVGHLEVFHFLLPFH